MSISTTYKAICAVCGATKDGEGEVFKNTGWRKTVNGESVLSVEAWVDDSYGDDCICPDCYAKYEALKEAADEAAETARKALKKQSGGGSGTEDDPYVFVPNQLLTLASFYCETAGSDAYAYMPADGTPKTYAAWADALPDMVRF